MINFKNYIGQNKEGCYIFQEIGDNGLIRGFHGFDLVELVDGERGLDQVRWTHKETINGKTHKTGEKPAPVLEIPSDIYGLYEVNTVSCEECGARHDSEHDVYGNAAWVIVNECEVYCKECVKADDLMIEVNKPSDLFKAKDVQDIDLNGYIEVDTLFCDSSGFGAPGERALTKNQALKQIEELLDTSNDTLYAGITGIGQFQVYVTLYRKAA